jgi:hypothetical protein
MKEALCSPKRRFLQEPRGVTSQKTPFFIVTAVKTSSFTVFGNDLIYYNINQYTDFILYSWKPLYFLCLAWWIIEATSRKVAGLSLKSVIEFFFSICRILPDHYRPGLDPASNRMITRNVSEGLQHDRWVSLTTSAPPMRRISRQCVILNISLPFSTSLSVSSIALLFYM